MYELHDICLILQDNTFVTGEFDRIIDSISYLQYLLHYLTDNHLSPSYVLDYPDWIYASQIVVKHLDLKALCHSVSVSSTLAFWRGR